MNARGNETPADISAERAVLGQAMLDGLAMVKAADVLAPGDFYREAHARLWQVMLDMSRRGAPTEMAAVCSELVKAGLVDLCGGVAYVSSLPDAVPSTENVGHYAGIVQRAALLRRLIEASREIDRLARDGSLEMQEVLDGASRAVTDVVHSGHVGGRAAPMMDLVPEALRLLEEAEERRKSGVQVGLSLPWVDLGRMLAIKPTDLIIVAGRPAMGKTAFGLQMVATAASRGEAGLVFSLEMGREQCSTRILCQMARVTGSDATRGYLDPEGWNRLHEAAPMVADMALTIDDTAEVTVETIRARVAREKAKNPALAWVMVDYVGLMRGDPRQARHEQVAGISRGLKLCAKESDVAVLALVQLNRDVEKRPRKLPQMSDLRDSGGIEQDADAIVLLYREDYYFPDTTTRPNVADIIVAKQRGGPTGTVELAWDGPATRFDDLSRHPGAF